MTIHNKKTLAAAYNVSRPTLDKIISTIPDFGEYRYRRFTQKQIEMIKAKLGDTEDLKAA